MLKSLAIAAPVFFLLLSCLPDRELVKPLEPGGPTNPLDSSKINIRINEVVSNGSPDWFELVNLNDTAVQMNPGQWYFTDDFKNPTKYQLNSVYSLPPKSYRAVEVANGGPDSDVFQLRANTFSFSSQGEQVAVLKITGRDTIWVDSVTFPAMSSGSYGRKPNGTGSWRLLPTETKGAPNP